MIDFIQSTATDFRATLLEMSPYLLFGFLMAGVLSVFISQRLVEKHLGRKGIWSLVKASLFGVPLPLCSCGVIPVTMSLHKHGAGKGAAISFLLSTPQTGVDSILVTLSLLGPVFAIFRPLAAFVTGIIGGTLVNIFDKQLDVDSQNPEDCTESCCEINDKKILRSLKYGFVTLPKDIGRAMLAGLFIAAIISALVPEGFFAEHLGTGIFSMIVMMFLGIPVYVCATASVPVAAVLIAKGLTPGAAIVFLMTGPATNAASIVTIWKTLGTKTALAYLISVAGCALLSGIILDYFFAADGFQIITHHAWMLPQEIKYVTTAILLPVLIIGAIRFKSVPDE